MFSTKSADREKHKEAGPYNAWHFKDSNVLQRTLNCSWVMNWTEAKNVTYIF
jgi:hypothetical protein